MIPPATKKKLSDKKLPVVNEASSAGWWGIHLTHQVSFQALKLSAASLEPDICFVHYEKPNLTPNLMFVAAPIQ